MTTNLEVKQFKQAAKKLQSLSEYGLFEEDGNWLCGLCYMLTFIASHRDMYDIMSKLLTKKEYHDGLGALDDFNTDREVFLEFLAYTLSAEDILDICNNKG